MLLIIPTIRYYEKQNRDDMLKVRRARIAEEKKKEENLRLAHFGLASSIICRRSLLIFVYLI